MRRFSARMSMPVLLAAVLAVGCTQDRETAQGEERDQPKQPRFETLVIPAGTSVVASLDTGLSTAVNHTGDPFVATTTQPIMVGGRTAVAAGARIQGVLNGVQASGRTKGRAKMTLAYQQIVDTDGKTHAISAQPLTIQAASKTHGDVEKIAAGGVLGALIGGIAGGGKGAAIGAGRRRGRRDDPDARDEGRRGGARRGPAADGPDHRPHEHPGAGPELSRAERAIMIGGRNEGGLELLGSQCR